MIILKHHIFLLVLTISAATDIACGRILNRVLFPGAVCIAVLDIISLQNADALSLAYLICFISILFILFTLRLMGGGDVKLYALTALAYPDWTGLRITVMSVLAAGIVAVFLMITGGSMSTVLKNTLKLLKSILQGRGLTGSALRPEERSFVPMAPCVLICALAVLSGVNS